MICVFKRIRKGAYEANGFLVVRSPWLNERWDGPRERFLPWKVFHSGSYIEKRVFLDGFLTRREAFAFVEQRLRANRPGPLLGN